MTTSPTCIRAVRFVEVRKRSTTRSDSSVADAETSYCPARQGTVEIDTCRSCPDCLDIGTEPWGGRVVVCRSDTTDHQPSRDGEPLLPESLDALKPHDADGTRVTALMTANVVCVSPDVGVAEVARLLTEKGVSGLPVVDESGHPVGVVSRTDLVRLQVLGEGPAGKLVHGAETAADLMTPVTFSLREHASVAQAAALMAFEGIHRVPIVSDANRVVGILSATDVMRWLGEQHGYIARRT
jgi:CBS-domain-containing membrane protein